MTGRKRGGGPVLLTGIREDDCLKRGGAVRGAGPVTRTTGIRDGLRRPGDCGDSRGGRSSRLAGALRVAIGTAAVAAALISVIGTESVSQGVAGWTWVNVCGERGGDACILSKQ